MKKEYICAACDFGASSGRVITGAFDGERIRLAEASRFPHGPVFMNGDHYWDLPYLFGRMLDGLSACARGGALYSAGIDTWGCDFGLLDKNGRLMFNPLSYRDEANESAMREVHEILGEHALYERTGVVNMALNTVYQLYKQNESAGALVNGRR